MISPGNGETQTHPTKSTHRLLPLLSPTLPEFSSVQILIALKKKKKNQDKLVFQVVSRELGLSHGSPESKLERTKGLKVPPRRWRRWSPTFTHRQCPRHALPARPFPSSVKVPCKTALGGALPAAPKSFRAPASPPSSRPRPLVRPHLGHELYCPQWSNLARVLSSQDRVLRFSSATSPPPPHSEGQTQTPAQNLGEEEARGRSPCPSSLGTPPVRLRGALYEHARPAHPRTLPSSHLEAAVPFLLCPSLSSG